MTDWTLGPQRFGLAIFFGWNLSISWSAILLAIGTWNPESKWHCCSLSVLQYFLHNANELTKKMNPHPIDNQGINWKFLENDIFEAFGKIS